MIYPNSEAQGLSPQLFFEAIAAPVIYNADSPYKQMTKKLNDIDIAYFQEGLPLGNRLDESIKIEIKKRIVNDFTTYGRQLYESSDAIRQQIIANVRQAVGKYPDLPSALADLSKAMEMMHLFVRKQLGFVPIPMYNSAELRELYAAAQKVTLVERVTGGNAKDVIVYYHALIEHTAWVCRMLTRRRASQFLMQMVDCLSREYDVNSPFATMFNDAPSLSTDEDLPPELLPLRELMAENVHKVWMTTRKQQGWKYGPKRNDATKEHPCMVPYDKLPEEEKEYDRKTSSETIRFILRQGFQIGKK